jgi:zinc protease
MHQRDGQTPTEKECVMFRVHRGIALVPLLVLAMGALVAAPPARAQEITPPKIEYEKHVLSNGLTLILHEDHSVPIVAVNLWYHVGSKNEKPGRTGFAHLFEHMMFQGSEHHDTDFFLALDAIGATDRNGTTNNDRTNYFENVPTNALEMTLWLEADRMGWLLPAMTQERLDNQIEVVKNERRQRVDNQPYGQVSERLYSVLYPRNHPHSWPVIGYMEDLAAATRDDVTEFFKTYYGPNNCTLVIAGDIDVDGTRKLVEKYFGEIPPGPPVQRPEAWIPELKEEIRLSMEDRVPLPRLYVAWHSPARFAPGDAEMDILVGILAGGKTSRLYKRLVYDLQIAQDVRAYQRSLELGSLFRLHVTAKRGHTLDEIEPILFEEIEKLRQAPPSAKEVERARTTYLSDIVRGLDRLGGFGGKSDLLGLYNTYTGDPGYIEQDFARYHAVTPESAQAAARRWLHQGRAVMRVNPYPDLKPAAARASLDRSVAPPVGDPPPLRLPRMERATLANGLQVILARSEKVPVVQLNLIVRGGWSSDPQDQLGLASFAGNMLDEGTTRRSALAISEEVQLLGAELDTDSGLDSWEVNLTALKARLEPSLELWADVILNPAFPKEEVERQRKQVLGRILQEKKRPTSMAFRIMPGLLYGEGHPYGQPRTGSGTEAAIASLTRADLVGAHATWFKPGNATAVIVGDISLDDIVPLLERHLGSWKGGPVPALEIPPAPQPERTRIYVIDKPDAAQSFLLAVCPAPPRRDPDDVPLQVLNTILGGQFTARLNMNLREDKGYTYGARTRYFDARGPGALVGYAQVRTDVTKESLAEMIKEFGDIRAARPPSREEVDKAHENMTLSLPGQYESLAEIADKITDIVTYDLPEDYYDTFPDKVRGTDGRSLTELARRRVLADRMLVLVVGDRDVIEEGIRELDLGPIEHLDADGNPVRVARKTK